MKIKKYLKNCTAVYHTTLDPKSQGVIRMHLVPPKKLKPGIPWVVIINGYSVLPLQTSWAVILKEFIEELNLTEGKEFTNEELDKFIQKCVNNVAKIFKNTDKKIIKSDMKSLIDTIKSVALGKKPAEEIGYMTLSKYAKFMSAPHRMDLMISSMEKNGCWNCNQKCLHCYAANEVKSAVAELNTEEWKKVIDGCREAHIPSLTFTGGEPTIREDLVELIGYAKWFVTRLNTNGIKLTKKLCSELYEASLDSVQVTLYSYDENIHNTLVGGNHFKETVEGIKNAINAGLDVSINTPLCSVNNEYINTMKFAKELGVKYFSCSGLIPTGNAKLDASEITSLSKNEILEVVKSASMYAVQNDLELAFTSPGWIDAVELNKLKLVVPSCGACLSNMAIAPNGDVIPCQSWLNGISLGNMLKEKFKTIWDNENCKKIRTKAIHKEEVCLLKEEK